MQSDFLSALGFCISITTLGKNARISVLGRSDNIAREYRVEFRSVTDNSKRRTRTASAAATAAAVTKCSAQDIEQATPDCPRKFLTRFFQTTQA
jgi:hypothetical protein